MSFHEVVAELPRVPSRRTPGVVTSSPYSRPYLQGLLGSVPSLRPAHQHDAAMLLALTLGAGFRASEVAHATGPFDPAQGLVTASGFRDLAPRQVPIAQVVLGQMSMFLEPVPAGRTLIRPARVATTTRLVGRFVARAWPEPPNLRRLRSSWIVGALSTGIDPSCLSDLAGTCDLTPYVGWARIPAAQVADPRLIVPGTPGVWEVRCG
ncbi:hypothetical protein CIP107514_01048 [Corynebacterium diphtheriae]|nr:hypothetical protein CIP107514_01048 [Corynebacterium diphtheriae]